MDEAKEIRLAIVRAVLPVTAAHGIQNIEEVTKKCSTLEKYVLGSNTQGAGVPDAPTTTGKKKRASKPKPR